MSSHSMTSLTVVVNNYNYGRFLRDAVDSALGQDWQDTQVLVVDDGSTDDSRAIVDEYADRVTVITKRNGGQASTFNAALPHCRGDVVVFLDADDTLASSAGRRALELFTDPTTVNVHWPLRVTDATGAPLGRTTPPLELADGDLRQTVIDLGPDSYVVVGTSGNAWARSFLREVFPIPEEDYRNGADGYLTTLAPLHGIIRRLDGPHGTYRVHGDNVWASGTLRQRNQKSIARFERRVRTLEAHLSRRGVPADVARWREVNPHYRWVLRLERVLDKLETLLPLGADVLLIDDNQWGTALAPGRDIVSFPSRNGEYLGSPSDDANALEQFEQARRARHVHVVLGFPAFWWREVYPEWYARVRSVSRCLIDDEDLAVFEATEMA